LRRLILTLSLLFICSTGWAAFPTTPILDNFNRADEGPPPSTDWISYDDGLQVVSNQATAIDTEEYGWTEWIGDTFGPDVEVYFTIVTRQTNQFGLYISDYGTDYEKDEGYAVFLFNISSTQMSASITRSDGFSYTELGSSVSAFDFEDGDKIGFSRRGDDVILYKDVGSGWEVVATRTDSTHTLTNASIVIEQYDAGSFGLVIDDFGGGNAVITNNNFFIFF
jgi:hypothetical protein